MTFSRKILPCLQNFNNDDTRSKLPEDQEERQLVSGIRCTIAQVGLKRTSLHKGLFVTEDNTLFSFSKCTTMTTTITLFKNVLIFDGTGSDGLGGRQ